MCLNQLLQDEDSGKKSKKSPYVSPGKGKPCPECNKEFRNQAVLDRFENVALKWSIQRLTFQAF